MLISRVIWQNRLLLNERLLIPDQFQFNPEGGCRLLMRFSHVRMLMQRNY